MQHRAGGEHFGIKQRTARQQAMEEPAMPVGPFHHRSDTKAPLEPSFAIFLFFQSLDKFPIYLMSYHFQSILTHFCVCGTMKSYFGGRVVPRYRY